MVLDDTDWSYTHELAILEEEFDQVSTKARADEFKKMSKALTVSGVLHLNVKTDCCLLNIETSGK
jgi:hypothetical protein